VLSLQFLCNIITQSVIAASANASATPVSHTSVAGIHMKWSQLVMKLAPLLGVSIDLLMRRYVVDLYTSGLDKIAQEVGNHCVVTFITSTKLSYVEPG